VVSGSEPTQFFSRAPNFYSVVSRLAAHCSDCPASGMLCLVGTIGSLEALGPWERSVRSVMGGEQLKDKEKGHKMWCDGFPEACELTQRHPCLVLWEELTSIVSPSQVGTSLRAVGCTDLRAVSEAWFRKKPDNISQEP